MISVLAPVIITVATLTTIVVLVDFFIGLVGRS